MAWRWRDLLWDFTYLCWNLTKSEPWRKGGGQSEEKQSVGAPPEYPRVDPQAEHLSRSRRELFGGAPSKGGDQLARGRLPELDQASVYYAAFSPDGAQVTWWFIAPAFRQSTGDSLFILRIKPSRPARALPPPKRSDSLSAPPAPDAIDRTIQV
jgi:hypothetical protein